MPDAKLYGPDGVCEAGFADPAEGGIPADVAAKFQCSVATLPADEYPPEGQEFFTQFSEKYGEDNPDPYAIYGYEAMRLALDAIERSGTGAKEDVLAALFDTQDRESVLGTYSIDENGDTTLTDYGIYTVEGGELTFGQTIAAAVADRSLRSRCRGLGRNSRPRRPSSERVAPTWKPQAFPLSAPPHRVRRSGTSSRSTD